MILLSKSTYKAAIDMRINSKLFLPHTCHLDTGAGPNHVNKAAPKREWLSSFMTPLLPCLRTATKNSISLAGNTLLIMKICYSKVQIWFGIVDSLPIVILSGTVFIDRYMQGILHGARRVVPWHLPPIELVSRNSPATVQPHLSEQN